jgi:alpha-galactosidase
LEEELYQNTTETRLFKVQDFPTSLPKIYSQATSHAKGGNSAMTKVVIIGAGSQFGGKLSRDILALPALQAEVTIALCDTDPVKLGHVEAYVRRIVEGHQLPATIEASTDRRTLLDGADFVVASISVGGPAYAGFPFTAELNLPFQKYGLSQSVADTIGVGGIFRFLRTAPEQLAVCRDMEAFCPDALLLNYTNPMAMLTWLHSSASKIANVGLCHSVQHTLSELSGFLGVPRDEVTYFVAGINHQAWFLELKHGKEDLYPRLRACLDDPETLEKDRVRFEMMRFFDYFVTESSKHCSEYHPYFRRTPELREHYGLDQWIAADQETSRWKPNAASDPLPSLEPSEEYAAKIINAVFTGDPFAFYGNVINTGLIDNLPSGCCVEVPCLVGRTGVHPCHVGPLPPQLAHLNLSNIAPQELAVQAVIQHDRRLALQACLLDPLTRSVLSLDAIQALFDEIWAAEENLLGWFSV